MRIDLNRICLWILVLIMSYCWIDSSFGAATISKGVTWTTGKEVTAALLNSFVDDATIADINQTNMASNNGVVVTGASAPSDTDALWRDSGNSNIIKYYSGSSWSRVGDNIPTGTIFAFSGETVPDGWLECDGSAVSRTTYSDLYSVTGDAWGEGDGSTTFNIPTCTGYFLRGWDHTAGNDPNSATRTAVQTGGETGDKVGSFQDDELEAHTHTYVFQPTATQSGTGVSRAAEGSTNTTSSTGGDETRPMNVYVMYIVKY